jgi:hypothetical protein
MYMHPFAHYAQTVNRLKAIAAAKGAPVSVVLVTGSHLKDEHIARLGLAQERTTERVLQLMKEQFEAMGAECTIRAGGNPDEDFLYMCRAPAFIPSGGGYSELISNYRFSVRGARGVRPSPAPGRWGRML